MAKTFDALVRRTASKKVQARAEQRTREMLGELLLSGIRKRSGKTQQDVARTLGMKQPSLSKLEKQSDMQISTLRRIVKALGGNLEVTAHFPQGAISIQPFASRRAQFGRARSEAKAAS